MSWRAHKKPRFSKNKLFLRDNFECAYCGKIANTVDHVLPRSKGGETTWLNTVSSCLKCNHKKSNRTPEDAGMKLRFLPREPSWYELA